MLGVDMTVFASYWLKQVLAGDDLRKKDIAKLSLTSSLHSYNALYKCSIYYTEESGE